MGSTNSNFGEDPKVSCVSKKDEREKVTKWIWTTIYTQKNNDPSIDTFSFNMHIFDQYTRFHSIGIFSVNIHIFIEDAHF